MKIKPIKQIWTTDGVHVVQIKIYDPYEVRELEEKYGEAIEALVIMGMENTSYEERHDNCRRIAEKAYNKSFDEIREGRE